MNLNKKTIKEIYRNARNEDLYEKMKIMGFYPTKESEKIAWYCSPLRNEKTASFKIDRIINKWYDHGLGLGGNTLDFYMKYFNCSPKEALEKINGSESFLFQPQVLEKKVAYEKLEFKIVNVIPILAPKLLDYIKERNIGIEIASKYCKQVNYLHGKKSFYSIGFKNEENGYELRNKIFKNCIGTKTYTYFKNGSKKLAVFEGFFDFLSFHELFHESLNADFLILNSVGMYPKSKPAFHDYNIIDLYLDNDEAGTKKTNEIIADFDFAVDRRDLFKEYNDLNEYLINRNAKLKI